jgi:hypothetical protein
LKVQLFGFEVMAYGSVNARHHEADVDKVSADTMLLPELVVYYFTLQVQVTS